MPDDRPTLPDEPSGADPYADLYANLFAADKPSEPRKYVPLAEQDFDSSQARAKLIAFYLPQFHPIPENDQWWGEGFTEWTNVRKARPNFVGHYQPREPGDLGYYDLRDIEVQKRQIALARKYGVYGFCFYYYWFSGKRLLEKPLDQFLQHTELDFPFCICWANENWTRRWDGRADDVLIGQDYAEDDAAAFIRDVAPILRDERYIRVNGRPLLAVYRVSLLPDAQKAAAVWRSECRRLGIGEIYLAAIQSFGIEDPRPYGFDAAIEFPPHNCMALESVVHPSHLQLLNPEFAGSVRDYRVAAQNVMDRPVPDYALFRTVMTAWDNTARRQDTPDLFVHASPAAYQEWLTRAIDYTCEHHARDDGFVFVNAWNEWAEGTYLEPDAAYGYAFLQATREALRDKAEAPAELTEAELRKQVASLQRLLIQEGVSKEKMYQSFHAQLAQREHALQSLSIELGGITQSKSWRLALLLRSMRARLIPNDSVLMKPARFLFRMALRWRAEGSRAMLGILKRRLFGEKRASATSTGLDYSAWITQSEPDEQQLAAQIQASRALANRPLISILTPVYNTPPDVLQEMIQSVVHQTYDCWELCLVDGASTNHVREVIRHWQELDPRIKCKFLDKNLGISGNTNAALQMAAGEYVTLLDHDDLLPPFALFEIASYIDQHPAADMIYGDEDHVDMGRHRNRPFFKPDWSPDLLQAFMYVGHCTYRSELVRGLGGFRSEYDFSQDYDLALRASELAGHIGHIPKVLYHWRELPGSAAAGGKDYARQSNIAALADAVRRRGYAADVFALPTSNYVKFEVKGQPLVSIIVPSDDAQNIEKSLGAVLSMTSYPNIELIIVTKTELADALRKPEADARIHFVLYDGTYNFSAKCNRGATAARGEYVLFLNDDVYPTQPDWVAVMLGVLQQKEVGAVAPKLVYMNGTIQHAGLVTGVRNLVGTAFHTWPRDSTDYFNLAQSPRTVSALTAACLLMPHQLFDEIGGYDEANTPIMHSDLDLCFKIRDRGRRLVYTPYTTLEHVGHLSIKEIEAGGAVHSQKADSFLLKRWSKYVAQDPYYPDNMRDLLYIDSPTRIRISASNTPESVNQRPDVLIQSHDLTLSGAPMIAHGLAVDLAARGYFPVAVAGAPGTLAEAYKSEKIPVVVDPLIMDAPIAMAKLLSNFDFVVANSILAWRLVLTAKSLHIPVFWLIHEGDFGVFTARNSPDIRAALSAADQLVFPSRQTLNKYLELGIGKSFTAMFFGIEPPSLPARTSPRPPTGPMRILHVGSIETRKGQDILIAGLRSMQAEARRQVDVSFVGRVLEPAYYEDQLRSSAEFTNIHWRGSLPHAQVLELLADADLLVCSSRDETGPLAVYEAMALGKAVLSTPVGAVPEIISHGTNGMVFPIEEPRQLAAALESLLADRSFLQQLGRNALETYKNQLTRELFTERLVGLFNKSRKA